MNFTKRLTVVHHSNSSARYDDVFWLFFYQHAAAAAAVLRSSDVGCMAIVQQVGVHGQEGGGVRLCGSRRGASQSDFVPVTSGGPRQLPLANNPTAL